AVFILSPVGTTDNCLTDPRRGFLGRADLTPVYEMIFRRLRARGLDWTYSFPRLFLADMRPLIEQLKTESGPEWENYDPSKALQEQTENEEHDREIARIREELDQGYRESVEEAHHR